MTGRDVIPEGWLAHRVAVHAAGRTLVGDMAWRIVCPGCGTEAQLIADLPEARTAAQWHAHGCAALREMSWRECDACDGRGEVQWTCYPGYEHTQVCDACLGRGFARRDIEGVASA